jgi:hypothetical protein
MPGLEHGHVTIIACPDAGDDAPLAIGEHHHHHGKASHAHSPCPYAAASWLSFVGSDFIRLLPVLLTGLVLLAAAEQAASVPTPRHLRPFLRGPPLRLS